MIETEGAVMRFLPALGVCGWVCWITASMPLAAHGAEAQPVAPDACRLELRLPKDATVSVDGRDFGHVEHLDYSGLNPNQVYVAQLVVRFPGGSSRQRTLLIEGGRTMRLVIVDPQVGQPEVLVQTGRHWDLSMSLTPDGRYMAFGGNDSTAAVWEVGTGRKLRVYPTEFLGVIKPALTPDARLLIGGGVGGVIVWDAPSGQRLRFLNTHPMPTAPPGEELKSGLVQDLRLSPDGACLVVNYGEDNGQTKADLRQLHGETVALNPRTGERLQTLPHPKARPSELAFSPAGDYVAIGVCEGGAGYANELVLWNPKTGQLLRRWKTTSTVNCLAISPDGGAIAAGSYDGTISLWDATKATRLQSWKPAVPGPGKSRGSGMVTALAFHPDGREILAAARLTHTIEPDKPGGQIEYQFRNSLATYEVATGKTVRTYAADDAEMPCFVGYLPGARQLLADDTLLDAASGKKIRKLRAQSPLPGGSFLHDGRHALVGDALWDLVQGRCIRRFPGDKVVVSPDGRYAATIVGVYTKRPQLLLSDATTGRQVAVLEGHARSVDGLAFSPDSRRLLSGDTDGQVILWDVESARQLLGFQSDDAVGPFAVRNGAGWLAFSPDGRLALVASNMFYMPSFKPDYPQLWDLTTGRRVRTLRPPAAPGADPNSIADGQYLAIFSPDGQSIVTGGRAQKQGIIHWWDTATGQLIRTLHGHKHNIQSLAFSPNGHYLVSTSRDASVIVWDGRNGARLRDFAGVTGWAFEAAFAPDSRRVLISTTEGGCQLWDAGSGEKWADLINVDKQGDWLVVTPEGLFDGSEKGRQAVTFRVGGGFTVVPVERFFQDFYQPGLLADLWRGQRPVPAAQLGAKLAPAVRILAPASGTVVSAAEVALEVEVVDRGGGIRGPWLMHNGARVIARGTPKRDGKTLRGTFHVPLLEGENRLEVHAASADGSWESEPATLVLRGEKAAAKPDLHLLAIGVNRYRQGSINLRYAAVDAQSIAELFSQRGPALYGQGKVHVTHLLDEQATRQGIEKAVAQVAAQAKPQDILVVFLAGHGTTVGQRYFFIPHDFQQQADRLDDDVQKQGIAGDALGEWLGAVPARKRLLIFDTCQSGSTIRLTPTARNPFAFRGALERLSRSQGIFTLAATAATAEAQEVPQLGHGVLTYTLLAALGHVQGGPLQGQQLNPANRLVEVRDWFGFAQDKVPALTKIFFNEEQFVGFSGQGESFPVLMAEK